MTQDKAELVQYVLRATENFNNFFPIKPLRLAKEVRKEMIPELIKRIEYAVDCGVELPDPYMGHIYALYLLAEFRAEEAYEPMLRLLFLKEDTLEFLLGDHLTEGFASAIASVAMGRYEELLAIFKDRELYEFARLAAMSAIEIQTHAGLIDSLTLENHLLPILHQAIENQDVIITTAFASTASDLKLERLGNEVRIAFDRQLIDTSILDREFFEENFQTEEYGKQHFEQLVSTAEQSMSWLRNFKSESAEKVKRNDLCPCCSGKKFKHCCLRIV
ncbi:hypothetical protein, putative type III secreted [Waddlia chondrophila 2032/99]|nr:hypothetical protein, putative type III secreted [Waddlia chondrophila 2032/99]